MRIALFFLIVTIFASCQSAKQKLADEIKAGETKLFNDSIKILNTATANEVYKKYIQYADSYKDDTESAIYLFRAADLANGLRRPQESVSLYERLRDSYPGYKKSPAAIFMEGFIYETQLENKEKAKMKYREFIQQYPNHALTPSAQASLDQLNANLSDEDLIRKFEAQQKK
jgi:TolA-binding protein